MNTLITEIEIKDIRFPTSRTLDGSDAMNPDPDYSAAYVILKTNHPKGLEGHGLTFTIGRRNEICTKALEALAPMLKPGYSIEMKKESLIDYSFLEGKIWKQNLNYV